MYKPWQETRKRYQWALAGVPQWTECQPTDLLVQFLTWAHAWLVGQVVQKAANGLFFSFSLPSPLSKNKIIIIIIFKDICCLSDFYKSGENVHSYLKFHGRWWWKGLKGPGNYWAQKNHHTIHHSHQKWAA